MLDIVHGDLWDYHPEHWIVITTNLGWKANGENVMGAGVAKEAALRYPDLPKRYGAECQEENGEPFVIAFCNCRLILLPTKPLDYGAPHLSWRQGSDLSLIDTAVESLRYIVEPKDHCYLPPPGCGNGGLTLNQVMPILEKHLVDHPTKFHLVLRS